MYVEQEFGLSAIMFVKKEVCNSKLIKQALREQGENGMPYL